MDATSHRDKRSPELWQALGEQLAEPHGIMGRGLSRIMDYANTKPIAATLSLAEAWQPRDILEIGFGSGRSVQAILKNVPACRVSGIDRSADMVAAASLRNASEIANGRVDLVRGSADSLCWQDASFDCVIAINVAYFFGTTGREMKEIYRVLRPGGHAALYVTSKDSMKQWPFASERTHRTYDRDDLLEVLGCSGLKDATVLHIDLPFGIEGLIGTASK